jgi:hypothetical protein
MVVAAQAPHVEGHLEADGEDALVGSFAPLPQRVHPMVAVQGLVRLVVEVRRVIVVLAFALAHFYSIRGYSTSKPEDPEYWSTVIISQ